jgi:hypothetical protein
MTVMAEYTGAIAEAFEAAVMKLRGDLSASIDALLDYRLALRDEAAESPGESGVPSEL